MENEVSHWYLGVDCMRSVMVLPQVKHVPAERGRFGSVLRGLGAENRDLSLVFMLDQ